MNTGKFRKSLFGGFNRNDVSEYIVKLAAERNEYKERAERAEELLSAAEEQTAEPADEPCAEAETSTEAIAEPEEETCPEEEHAAEETEAPQTAEAPEEQAVPEDEATEEITNEGPVEMENVVREIVENVADIQMEKAILEIVENVNAIQSEINEREKQGASASREDLSDSINRVLGMLECTEAQFGLLAKTLKEIKSDVSAKNV